LGFYFLPAWPLRRSFIEARALGRRIQKYEILHSVQDDMKMLAITYSYKLHALRYANYVWITIVVIRKEKLYNKKDLKNPYRRREVGGKKSISITEKRGCRQRKIAQF